jgi:hypothetical protein
LTGALLLGLPFLIALGRRGRRAAARRPDSLVAP